MIAVARRTCMLAVLTMIAALAALALTVGVDDAQSASYVKCTLSETDQDPPGEKPTYNTKLTKRGTSCATAKKVMYGYHKCRSTKGVSCARKVLGDWRCSGTKGASIARQFTATFTCTYAGSRGVKGQFVQNT